MKRYRSPHTPIGMPLDLLSPIQVKLPAFALLGFACDEGVRRNNGRPGALKGPTAFRENFSKSNITFYDCGDIVCLDGDLEESQKELGEAVSILLKAHITPIVVGGGHELAWGTFLGIVDHHSNCEIINFDAHFDLRPLDSKIGSTSGTSFSQIQEYCQEKNLPFLYHCIGVQEKGNCQELFERAEKFGVDTAMAETIKEKKCKLNWNRQMPLMLSICLDVFSQSIAPGVSAPQESGLMMEEVLPLLEEVIKQQQAPAIFVIAELAPCYDKNNKTSKLCCQLFQNIVEFAYEKH